MYKANTAASPPGGPAVPLRVDEAVERMGDKEIYLEIARYFAAHLHDSLNALRSALDAGNSTEATRLAHSLKGNCATVGADTLREECLHLERLCRQGQPDEARAFLRQLHPKMLTLRAMLEAL